MMWSQIKSLIEQRRAFKIVYDLQKNIYICSATLNISIDLNWQSHV